MKKASVMSRCFAFARAKFKQFLRLWLLKDNDKSPIMKYFSIKELTKSETATRLKIDNTPTAEVIDNLTALVDNVLDPLRELYGKPIHISSGYRCPRLNKAVGGVANSQHLTGQAADINQGSHEENRRLFIYLEEYCTFDQLLWENGGAWIHVSFRKDGKNRQQVKRITKK